MIFLENLRNQILLGELTVLYFCKFLCIPTLDGIRLFCHTCPVLSNDFKQFFSFFWKKQTYFSLFSPLFCILHPKPHRFWVKTRKKMPKNVRLAFLSCFLQAHFANAKSVFSTASWFFQPPIAVFSKRTANARRKFVCLLARWAFAKTFLFRLLFVFRFSATTCIPKGKRFVRCFEFFAVVFVGVFQNVSCRCFPFAVCFAIFLRAMRISLTICGGVAKCSKIVYCKKIFHTICQKQVEKTNYETKNFVRCFGYRFVRVCAVRFRLRGKPDETSDTKRR